MKKKSLNHTEKSQSPFSKSSSFVQFFSSLTLSLFFFFFLSHPILDISSLFLSLPFKKLLKLNTNWHVSKQKIHKSKQAINPAQRKNKHTSNHKLCIQKIEISPDNFLNRVYLILISFFSWGIQKPTFSPQKKLGGATYKSLCKSIRILD